MVHCVPSQCSASVWGVPEAAATPTAQTLLLAKPTTASSSLSSGPALGLATRVQVAPSQCSVSVCSTPPLPVQPTAQMSLGAITATAKRRLSGEPLLALGTMLQPGVQ